VARWVHTRMPASLTFGPHSVHLGAERGAVQARTSGDLNDPGPLGHHIVEFLFRQLGVGA